jgi:hypothetical protein
MRRKPAAVLLALPVANAFSLANFQIITSVFIPISCLLEYDSQIPTCTASDFNNGCSAACVAALNSVAEDVTSACSEVNVSSKTLLGIVMNGGIVQALCPTLAKTTTSTVMKTSATLAGTTALPVNSVTLPTASPGVTGASTKTSSSTTKSSVPIAQSQVSSSTRTTSSKISSSTPSSTTISPTTTSLASAGDGLGGGAVTSTSTSTSKTSSKKTTSAATTTTTPHQDTGGGSPFDISSDSPHTTARSIWGSIVIAVLAGVLMGR